MLRSIGDLLRSPASLAVTFAVALPLFLLVVWLPNLGLIFSVVTSGGMSAGEKVGFLWSSLGAIRTNFTAIGAWSAGAIAALFGLNVALAARYIRRRVGLARMGGAGLGGMLVALVGVGCSACGAVVLSTLLGAGAAASFVTVLPLRGEELSILSVLVLTATLLVTARKAAQPAVCAVDLGTTDVHDERGRPMPSDAG